MQLNALVTDDRGQVLTGRPINFSSSNTAIATVSSAGLVTRRDTRNRHDHRDQRRKHRNRHGHGRPRASGVGQHHPGRPSVIIGQTVQLTAIAKNASGTVLNGRTVSWSSGAPASRRCLR
jgi:hypothetical protein